MARSRPLSKPFASSSNPCPPAVAASDSKRLLCRRSRRANLERDCYCCAIKKPPGNSSPTVHSDALPVELHGLRHGPNPPSDLAVNFVFTTGETRSPSHQFRQGIGGNGTAA